MAGPNIYHLLFALSLLISTTLFLRLITILPSIVPRPPQKKSPSPKTTTNHLMIILGSGGHTAEMLSMLRNISPTQYHHRSYIVSSGDTFSASKARAFEEEALSSSPSSPEHNPGTYTITMIPRARKIHQALYTTPFTSLYTLFFALKILTTLPPPTSVASSNSKSKSLTDIMIPLMSPYPDIILTNGPATGVLMVFASLILKFVDWRGAWSSGRMRTVYVESWARCRTLSLSGRILVWVVDRFLVQWESLKGAEGRAEFRGVLVN